MGTEEFGNDHAARMPEADKTSSERRQRHGIFTRILYLMAWVTAISGTLVGFAIPFMGPHTQNAELVLPAMILTIVGAWVGAAYMGTVAEISRKLTPRD